MRAFLPSPCIASIFVPWDHRECEIYFGSFLVSHRSELCKVFFPKPSYLQSIFSQYLITGKSVLVFHKTDISL
jgi:hypothetical protein